MGIALLTLVLYRELEVCLCKSPCALLSLLTQLCEPPGCTGDFIQKYICKEIRLALPGALCTLSKMFLKAGSPLGSCVPQGVPCLLHPSCSQHGGWREARWMELT